MNDVNKKRDEIVRKFKPVDREFDLLEDKISDKADNYAKWNNGKYDATSFRFCLW